MNFESWVSSYFYHPTLFQKLIALILFPFSLIYCSIATIRRKSAKVQEFPIPIISIGNLTVGGSGKTPLTIALSEQFPDSAIVLRGYGRQSQGLKVVSERGKILCDVQTSGDEAMLLAKRLPECSVIVSENRFEAIQKAVDLGCKRVFLDDGFRHPVKKFNILLRPKKEPFSPFCLPSGAYRESPLAYKEADLILQEGRDFERNVEIMNPTEKMILVTAIANPKRLDSFLPQNVIEKIYFPDHHYFEESELKSLLEKHQVDSILVTEKDAVKMEGFGLPLSVMELNLKLNQNIIERFHQV